MQACALSCSAIMTGFITNRKSINIACYIVSHRVIVLNTDSRKSPNRKG